MTSVKDGPVYNRQRRLKPKNEIPKYKTQLNYES
jgi:hypothetical protein